MKQREKEGRGSRQSRSSVSVSRKKAGDGEEWEGSCYLEAADRQDGKNGRGLALQGFNVQVGLGLDLGPFGGGSFFRFAA